MVVVVVIDVVFVKEKLGPKKFLSKKSMSKELQAKKFLGPKEISILNNLSPKNFGYKNFW